MKRWHSDVTHMRREMRRARELSIVGWGEGGRTDLGEWRKRKAWDCGHPKCGLCHFEKFWLEKARDNQRRRAIQFDLDAA